MQEANLLKKLVTTSKGFGCTTFALHHEDKIVFGRNFDFMIDYGHIIVNKRNVLKTALVPPSEKQVQWTSTFGSVTFNQVGREFPYGGINEAGLVIEQLWLDSTQYPSPDHRYGISVLQWIQYQLDVAEHIDDVIESDLLLRIIDDSGANLHFFVTDKNGDSACIEFIKGEMNVSKGKDLKVPVLTNSSYEESLWSLSRTKQEDPSQSVFTSNSLDRYKQTTELLREFERESSPNLIDYSFLILDTVKQANFTQWSIVYDISNLEVHFKTKSNLQKAVIHLEDFDFSSASPCLVSDLQSRTGKVHFETYSSANNLALINRVFDSLAMLKDIPQEIREISANYPEQTVFNDQESCC